MFVCRIYLGLALAWIFPLFISVSSDLLQTTDVYGSETRCIFTHLVPTYYIIFVISLIMFVLGAVYILYGIILTQFYHQRRKLDLAKTQRYKFVMPAHNFRLLFHILLV
jgi:hypothetical protein